MLKLTASAELLWLDLLPGVRLQVRPITVASMLVARDAVGKVFRGEDQVDVNARAGIALVRELALRGIVAWEGIGDADGKLVDPSPETIGALLDQFPAYDAIDRLYVTPALRLETEKNA